MSSPTTDVAERRFKRPRLRWRGLALALLHVLCGGGPPVMADDAPPLEMQVKAAFLVKLALFVEWPAPTEGTSAEAPFTIGLLGEDPFGDFFDRAVKNEKVNGRAVRLKRATQLSELKDCPVIFICASESKQIEALLRQLEGKPVLTVAEEPDFAKRGGMVNFIKENGRVRFEINVAAAEQAQLKLSAKLLQVGKIVAPGRAGGGGGRP